MGNFLTDVTPAILRKRAAVAIVAVVALVVAMEYVVRPAVDWFYPKQLLPLAQYVAEHGQPSEQHPRVANYFGIPNDGNPLKYQQIVSNSITGRSKAIKVRQRPTGQIDLMLEDVQPVQSGYFYLANVYGKLLKAAYLETQPQDVPDADERFAAEVRFWQDWLQVQQDAAAP